MGERHGYAWRHGAQMTAVYARGERFFRYSVLLAVLVAALVSSALVDPSPATSVVRGALSAAVLVAALASLGGHGRLWIVGLVLTIAALGSGGAAAFTGSQTFVVIDRASSAGFLGLVTLAIFASLLRSTRVTTDTLLGGVCVYLLLGIVFTFGFELVELAAPGALLVGGAPITPTDPLARLDPQLLYYSFATITSLGGDIAPRAPAARTLAAAEAVTGQLYLAVFVARLVTLQLHTQITDTTRREDGAG